MDAEFFKQKEYEYFRIDRIAMQNFRCFPELAIDFNRKSREIVRDGHSKIVAPLTVIVAKNGMGKTTVLDAIRIAYGNFTSGFSYKSPVNMQSYDIRVEKDRAVLAFPVVIDAVAEIDGAWCEWSRSIQHEGERAKTQIPKGHDLPVRQIDGQPAKHFVNKLKAADSSNTNLTLPLIASYGTNRLWKQLPKQEKKRNLVTNRTWGYSSCLDAAINYKDSFAWMSDAIIARLNEKQVGIQPNQVLNDQLKAIESSLFTVLDSEGYTPLLHINPFLQELAIVQKKENQGISIPVSHLSDGVRAIFFMVADIAFRCAKLNPHFKEAAAQFTPGIVLIDEVDLHLHPSWQQKVLDTLQWAFPNIQFIVTTHSPQVVSSVPKECVRIIENGKIVPFSTPTQGVEVGDILAGIFGTDPIPQNSEIAQKLNRLHAMLAEGKGDSVEWESLYLELEKYYGKDYPPLLGTKAHRDFLKKMKAGGLNA